MSWSANVPHGDMGDTVPQIDRVSHGGYGGTQSPKYANVNMTLSYECPPIDTVSHGGLWGDCVHPQKLISHWPCFCCDMVTPLSLQMPYNKGRFNNGSKTQVWKPKKSVWKPKRSVFSHFPTEIWAVVIHFLKVKDLQMFAQVCFEFAQKVEKLDVLQCHNNGWIFIHT